MLVRARVVPGYYKDSVALMRLSEDLGRLPGVAKVSVVMATPANKEILRGAGLLSDGADEAKPDDLIAAFQAESAKAIEAAFAKLDSLLAAGGAARDGGTTTKTKPRAIAQAVGAEPDIGLALISVPGPFAAAEALKAVRLGLDVLLFSDNVPLEQERALKEEARRAGRLVMGPDCGTAIVGGVPLGFANVVKRGAIGLVAASGTGLQQVTCLIDRLGEGISHAIGTGGRDASAGVGGIAMMQGIDLLATDPATKVIVLISKPPATEVATAVLARAEKAGKPVVVNFLGGDPALFSGRGKLIAAETLEDAATLAVAALRRRKSKPGKAVKLDNQAAAERRRLKPGQKGLRALFSGGTFCAEALMVWGKSGLFVHSNAPLDKRLIRRGGAKDQMHIALDLGADEFTVGKPHPMIDPSGRIDAIRKCGGDPAVAVVLLDVVLGYGAHSDPAGALVPAIVAAKKEAKRKGRVLPVIAFVCGTEADPQRLSDQVSKLRAAGAILETSSTRAARLAAAFVGYPK